LFTGCQKTKSIGLGFYPYMWKNNFDIISKLISSKETMLLLCFCSGGYIGLDEHAIKLFEVCTTTMKNMLIYTNDDVGCDERAALVQIDAVHQ